MARDIQKRDSGGDLNFASGAADTEMANAEAGGLGVLARREAETKASLWLATQMPRDVNQCYSEIIRACERPLMASKAAYRYPRGGTQISGPSVYLAREMARIFGHIDDGVRIVSVTDSEIHVEGYAWDMQTNNRRTKEAKFRAMVQRKDKASGQTRWVRPDDRDLRELIGKQGAICMRNAILELMPPDFIEAALDAAFATCEKAAHGEMKADRETTIRSLVVAFNRIGVTVPMIEEYLAHPMAQLTAKELTDLRGVYASIQDGNSEVSEHFGPKAKATDAPKPPAGEGEQKPSEPESPAQGQKRKFGPQ